jgi:hypothetical protein
MIAESIVIKIVFKGMCYTLMTGILKEGFKGIKEAGEAQNEDKSVLVPLGEHGFKMSLYGVAGLIVKDVATIIGVIPSPVTKAIIHIAPKVNFVKNLFPWL